MNGEANRVSKKQSSAIIAVDVRRFGHVINKDEVFGTHRAHDVINVAMYTGGLEDRTARISNSTESQNHWAN